MKKLIYIGGYGRSGSTLLERIIASHPKVIGCGELHNIHNDLMQDELCGCGKNASKCKVYKNIWNGVDQKEFDDLSFIEKLYIDDCEFIVDSSKTTSKNLTRPVLLEKKYEVYFIYLKRNLYGVVGSQLNVKKGYPFFIALTTVINRFFANAQAKYFTYHFNNSLIISYDDLVSEPQTVLKNIEELLGLSYDHINLAEQEIPKTHQLSGNAIRYEKPLFLKINKEIKNLS